MFDLKKGESEFEMVWISWKWILGLVSYFQLSARRDINGDITMCIYTYIHIICIIYYIIGSHETHNYPRGF